MGHRPLLCSIAQTWTTANVKSALTLTASRRPSTPNRAQTSPTKPPTPERFTLPSSNYLSTNCKPTLQHLRKAPLYAPSKTPTTNWLVHVKSSTTWATHSHQSRAPADPPHRPPHPMHPLHHHQNHQPSPTSCNHHTQRCKTISPSPAVNRITFEHRTKCRIAKYTNPAKWTTFIESNRDIMETHWPATDGDFGHMHSLLIGRFRSLFTSGSVTTSSTATDVIQHKWQVFQEIRQLPRHDCTCKRIFQGWSLLVKHTQLQRTHAEHARAARQIRFDALIEEAKTAADHHNIKSSIN